MKVFGIGLDRTGTTSLTEALALLGFKTLHYPNDPTTLHELRLQLGGPTTLSVLNRYDALTDSPIAICFMGLDAVYTGSKFILTVRSMMPWLASWHRHMALNPPTPQTAWLRQQSLGTEVFEPETMSAAYDHHFTLVRHYFMERPADLLVLDICGGDGWDKLCRFLGKPVPKLPFPHLNASRR